MNIAVFLDVFPSCSCILSTNRLCYMFNLVVTCTLIKHVATITYIHFTPIHTFNGYPIVNGSDM